MPTARRRSSLAAVLLLLAASLAEAQSSKPAAPPPEYPYELVPVDAIYGHLSEGRFQEPLGLGFDAAAQELLVADSKNGLIGIYNKELTPVFAFGGPALLVEPQKVEVLQDGSICVLDALQTELRRFTYRGDKLPSFTFSCPAASGTLEPVRVRAFAHAANGSWFIAAQGNDTSRLLRFDAQRNFVDELAPSKKAGSYHSIVDIALSPQGRLAVADQSTIPVVHVYDPDGTLVAAFGAHDVGLQDFTTPIAMTFDSEGYLYVVDLLRHDVKVYTSKGEFLGRFGGWNDPKTRGRAPGEMLYPSGIVCAPDGRIFVSERFGGRVQCFERRAKPKPQRPSPAAAR